MCARAVNTRLLLMLVAGRHANEKLRTARNEHKNESFYAYENVMRLLNIVHHYFFRLCRIYAIIAIKNDFAIH